MNAARLLWSFIGRRPLDWSFQVLSLALGVTLVTLLLVLAHFAERRLTADLAGVDLVIGAKGSPMQLILSAVLNADAPTGNIRLSQAERYASHPLVKQAVPVSLGDSVRGFRIVGTTPEYPGLFGARVGTGRMWSAPLEAVLGARTAQVLGLALGDTFHGEHGLTGGEAHGEAYHVVGILDATGAPIDRLALTSLDSVWRLHAEHEEESLDTGEPHETGEPAPADREVTALLVRYKSPLGAVMLPAAVRGTPDLQPAVPAVEVARLMSLLGVGAEVLRGVTLAFAGIALLGFALTLNNAVGARRRDLALLSALGAGAGRLWRLVVAEALLLGLVSGIIGVLVARTLLWVAVPLAARAGIWLRPEPPGLTECVVIMTAMLLAGLASFPAAFAAARRDPAQVLNGG